MSPRYSVSDKQIENNSATRGTSEAPPAEGDVASAVDRKGHQSGTEETQRIIASPRDPGPPKLYGESDLTAGLPRKAAEHEQLLEEREKQGGQLPEAAGGEAFIERERAREQKLDRVREIDVPGAVKEATGGDTVAE